MSKFSRVKIYFNLAHYTHHENIRIRYKRWLPTIAHSIYWFSIEKPKDYHKNLMIAWEEKRTNKNKRLL